MTSKNVGETVPYLKWTRIRRAYDPKALRVPWDLIGCTVRLNFKSKIADDNVSVLLLTNLNAGLTLETVVGTPTQTKIKLRDLTEEEESIILALPNQSVYSDLEILFPSEGLPRKVCVVQFVIKKDIL